MNSTEFTKLKTSTNQYIIGMMEFNPDYGKVYHAIKLAEKYHTGTRKDGITHEFEHQLNIFSFLRSLTVKSNIDRVELLVAAILHDTPEDYPESLYEINKLGINTQNVVNLSKEHNGIKMTNEQYYNVLLDSPITALVKLVDRIHNLSTIKNLTEEKQLEYVKETKEFVIPLAIQARKKYPELTNEFDQLKQTLNIIVGLL